jgi:YfiH family protein
MLGMNDTTARLCSPLLAGVGVPHAFSTRDGGVSAGVFASLNFGNPSDLAADRRDPASNIRRNWSIVLESLGAAEREIVEVHQVHGDGVHCVHRGGPSHSTPDGRDTRADAVLCDDPGRVVAVRVADCCPVLISTTDGSLVGAVHAGWRGAVGGVLVRALESMQREWNVRPGQIVAAIGPCIGADAFEVGPEVARAFEGVFGAGTRLVRPRRMGDHDEAGKFMVDLKGALREQLLSAGVLASQIDVRPECTVNAVSADGRPVFFSHRRDAGVTGRMVGVIGPRRD